MQSENERRLILEMIEKGKITAAEGLRLLKALDVTGDEPPALEGAAGPLPEAVRIEDLAALPGQAEPPETGPASGPGEPAAQPEDQPTMPDLPPEMKRWNGWWMLPLWVGVAITVLAGLWMYQSLQASGVGFAFICASLPFLIGLVLIILAWQSRNARWLHLRIWQKKGTQPEKITISFPLPLGLANWGLRRFKHRIPGLENTSVDELIQALEQSSTPHAPFYVEVQDDEDGERVQVYIG